MEELIAGNAARYVETAVALGKDPAARGRASARIAENRHELFERDEPIRALENVLEAAFAEGPAG
jgi:predicted O-linked N-acetylglucosamine transferase (SPINDLY family)